MKNNAMKNDSEVEQPLTNNQEDSTFGSVFANNTQQANASNFGSEFGANAFGATNAASQIFQDPSLTGDKKRKIIRYVGGASLAILILGAAFVWFGSNEEGVNEDEEEEEETTIASVPTIVAEPKVEASVVAETVATVLPEATVLAVETPVAVAPEAPVAETASDAEGTWTYNEVKGGPLIKTKEGALIEVSRNEDFSTMYVYGPIKNGQYRIPNPPPGIVFWREKGSTTVQKITVNAPTSIGISFSAPGAIAVGETLSWSASGKVAFYRIEFSSDKKFTNISNIFSTKGTSIAIKDVSPGKYFVRVGGLNENAGKFEYSSVHSVEVK